MSRRHLAPYLLAVALGGCTDLDTRDTGPNPLGRSRGRGEPRWSHSILTEPPCSAGLRHETITSRDTLIGDVTVYGYTRTRLHFSLDETTLVQLLDAAGGLPRFGGRGRTHLGTVRASVRLPGGEGYRFSFKGWRRRDALALLAEIADKAIIVGPDVLDTIDVEVDGAPPVVLLRMLSDEGGVIILEDDF